MITFQSIEQMLEAASESGLPLWECIQASDCRQQGVSAEVSWRRMSTLFETMAAADAGYREEDRSHSGLSGGDGGKMARYGQEPGDGSLCGGFFSEVIAGALRMGECNACVGLRNDYCGTGLHFRGCGRLSGGNRVCRSHGRTRVGVLAGRRRGTDGPRVCYSFEESSGACLRPGRRSGGGPLRETERDRRDVGSAARPGPGRHAESGTVPAAQPPGDGPGWSGRYALRTAVQAGGGLTSCN